VIGVAALSSTVFDEEAPGLNAKLR
jgi:hypothetical protein